MSHPGRPLRPCGAGRAAGEGVRRTPAATGGARHVPDHDHRRRPGGPDRRRRLRRGRRGGRRARGARDPRRARPGHRCRPGLPTRDRTPSTPTDRTGTGSSSATWSVRPGRCLCVRSAGLDPPRRAPAPDAAGGRAAAAAHRRRRAPVDVDFHAWATGCTARAARAAAALLGVVTYDADPGRLSAAFMWDLLLRVTAPRAPVGAVARRRLAVRGRPVGGPSPEAGRPDRDVVPRRRPARATGDRRDAARVRPVAARDDTLSWESGRCVLLDVGLVATRRDAFLVFDLDDAGSVERSPASTPPLAPAGHALLQADMPLRPGGAAGRRLARLEASSTSDSRPGGSASSGGAPGSRRAVPAPWTCPIHLARPAGGRPRGRGLPGR